MERVRRDSIGEELWSWFCPVVWAPQNGLETKGSHSDSTPVHATRSNACWDASVRRSACTAADRLVDSNSATSTLRLAAKGEAATWALLASLFCKKVDQLDLTDLPVRNRDAPDMLNISRFVEMPQLAMLAASRVGRLTLHQRENEVRRTWQAICQSSPLAGELIQLAGPTDVAIPTDLKFVPS